VESSLNPSYRKETAGEQWVITKLLEKQSWLKAFTKQAEYVKTLLVE